MICDYDGHGVDQQQVLPIVIDRVLGDSYHAGRPLHERKLDVMKTWRMGTGLDTGVWSGCRQRRPALEEEDAIGWREVRSETLNDAKVRRLLPADVRVV